MLAGLHVACAFWGHLPPCCGFSLHGLLQELEAVAGCVAAALLWHLPPCRAAAWMGCCSSCRWVLAVLHPQFCGICCPSGLLQQLEVGPVC